MLLLSFPQARHTHVRGWAGSGITPERGDDSQLSCCRHAGSGGATLSSPPDAYLR